MSGTRLRPLQWVLTPGRQSNLKASWSVLGSNKLKRRLYLFPLVNGPQKKVKANSSLYTLFFFNITILDQREKGFLYKQVIKALFKSMRPWWISELGVTEQEYDKVVIAAMGEFDEQQCYIDWVIYTARKPVDTTLTNTTTTTTTDIAN